MENSRLDDSRTIKRTYLEELQDYSNKAIQNQNKPIMGLESTLERLIEDKKQLVQEHSKKMLFKEQKIRTLQNQMAVRGIQNQQLKKKMSNEEIADRRLQEAFDSLETENKCLLQRITQLEAVLDYLSGKISCILGYNEEEITLGINSVVHNQSQSVSLISIDELEKQWDLNKKKLEKLQVMIVNKQEQGREKETEIRLLHEHLKLADRDNKRAKLVITSLHKILEAAEKEKRKVCEEVLRAADNLNLQKMTLGQMKKVVQKLILKQKELSGHNKELAEELYCTKKESTIQLQCIMERMGRVKDQMNQEASKQRNKLI